MNLAVCLSAPGTLSYPEGGGHLWVGLNWALGLREVGCRVLWLETAKPHTSEAKLRAGVTALKTRLQPYGLDKCVVLATRSCSLLPSDLGCLDVDEAADVDLLISLGTNDLAGIIEQFKRSAFIDIDPGLLQIWANAGQVRLSRYDTYFSIGETVGRPYAGFPDLGLKWNYTPPCVSLSTWSSHGARDDAPFTTLAHWHADAWLQQGPPETKRDGFLPFLDLPRHTTFPLELALDLTPADPDRAVLKERGWRIRDAQAVAGTPWHYQNYIQNSRGEFSCAKPSCMRLQNAWVSDRTLCYLATGKPTIVQHTGASRILPDAAGMFRFHTLDEAAAAIEHVVEDYPHQCRLARELAEEHFDARKVVRRVLEIAL
jgi:hypothetical protein